VQQTFRFKIVTYAGVGIGGDDIGTGADVILVHCLYRFGVIEQGFGGPQDTLPRDSPVDQLLTHSTIKKYQAIGQSAKN